MRVPVVSGLACLAAVLTSCSVGPSGASHPSAPTSRAGAGCAPSQAQPAQNFPQPAGGLAVGPGPAYPDFDVRPTPRLVEGGTIGLIHYGQPVDHGHHYAKTLWIIGPTVHSSLLVTGSKVGDPSSRMRFALSLSRSTPVLHLQGDSSWADDSSGLWFPGPGCYALRVQLPTRSYTITFRARQ